jgi:hypothetical protein
VVKSAHTCENMLQDYQGTVQGRNY